MELITERLILREFQREDFEAVHSYASNSVNVKYMIWGPNNEELTENFINECLKKQNDLPRLHYDFAVVQKVTGKLIGGCGIYLDDDLLQANLGWILHMHYWKQGYMPEVGKALIKFGFEDLKLHRIYATCNSDNYGSYRVMEKCGMRREAHMIKNRKGRVDIDKEWIDEFTYAILEDEWFVRI